MAAASRTLFAVFKNLNAFLSFLLPRLRLRSLSLSLVRFIGTLSFVLAFYQSANSNESPDIFFLRTCAWHQRDNLDRSQLAYRRVTSRFGHSFCARYICRRRHFHFGDKSVGDARANSSYLDAKCETTLGPAGRYLECSPSDRRYSRSRNEMSRGIHQALA